MAELTDADLAAVEAQLNQDPPTWSYFPTEALRNFGESNDAVIRVLIAALREARRDVVAHAEILMVDVPPPGTDMAKVMLANVAMRRERDSALAENARLREALEDYMESDTFTFTSHQEYACKILGHTLKAKPGQYNTTMWPTEPPCWCLRVPPPISTEAKRRRP